MKVILMAGGKGERLRPLTNTIPKPMVQVAGKPILEHIINLFKQYNLTEFIITLCYLPEKIVEYFGNGSKLGVNIDYIYEDAKNPLGTAGGVALVKKYVEETFIVASGDILRKLDITDMFTFHKKNNSLATINVYKRYGTNPKSMILFNEKGQITKFIERPLFKQQTTDNQQPKTNYVWANGSFYIFEPEVVDYIRLNTPSDFGKDIFPRIIKDGKKICAYPSSDLLIDIGNFEKLEKARAVFTS